jgi:intraflagellar transport protein 74
LSANIKIFDRPVTQHGILGVSSKPQGEGRRIADRSYYLNLLRQKGSEITQEISKFKKSIETIQVNNQQFVAYDKRYEELTKEVRELEGQLADYNLAFDK